MEPKVTVVTDVAQREWFLRMAPAGYLENYYHVCPRCGNATWVSSSGSRGAEEVEQRVTVVEDSTRACDPCLTVMLRSPEIFHWVSGVASMLERVAREELTKAIDDLRSELQKLPDPPDPRFPRCRERLRDEGKPYPKSGCDVCGNGALVKCPYSRKSWA